MRANWCGARKRRPTCASRSVWLTTLKSRGTRTSWMDDSTSRFLTVFCRRVQKRVLSPSLSTRKKNFIVVTSLSASRKSGLTEHLLCACSCSWDSHRLLRATRSSRALPTRCSWHRSSNSAIE